MSNNFQDLTPMRLLYWFSEVSLVFLGHFMPFSFKMGFLITGLSINDDTMLLQWMASAPGGFLPRYVDHLF